MELAELLQQTKKQYYTEILFSEIWNTLKTFHLELILFIFTLDLDNTHSLLLDEFYTEYKRKFRAYISYQTEQDDKNNDINVNL